MKRPSVRAIQLLAAATLGLLLAGRSDASAKSVGVPFDLEAVIDRVRVAFRSVPGGQREYEAQHPAYGVRVAKDGSFQVARGSSPLSFVTTGAGDVSSIQLGPEGAVSIVRDAMVERLANSRDGLEQSWSFDRAPAGAADLVVRVLVTGLDYSGSTPGGLHFIDPVSRRGVRYGTARWIDSRGTATPVSATWRSGQIMLRVPRSVVASSQFPAVLDPVIGPEIGSDNAVPTAAGGTGAQVVFDGTNWFVVWADQRGGFNGGSQIFGAHVTPAGVVIETYGIPIASSTNHILYSPQVGFNGSDYLVVWTDTVKSKGDLVGVRVSKAGALLDPTPFTLASAATGTAQVGAAQIASDGSAWLVVYMLDAGRGIAATRVNAAGEVDETIPVAPTAQAFSGYPHVAFDGTNYLVLYSDNVSDVVTMQARFVTKAGAVAGSAFDPAPGARLGGDYRNGPAVAFDGTNYLVVWTDSRASTNPMDLYAGLVDPEGGKALTGSGNKIFAGVSRAANPAVVFDGTNYMVAFGVPVPPLNVDAILYGARVSTSALVIDSAGINTTQTPEYEAGMAIAYDGNAGYLLTGGTGLGSRISKAGVLLDPIPFAIDRTGNRQRSPTATFDGTDYFVAWQDSRGQGGAVYGTRVTKSGTIRDPAGIAICTLPTARPDPPVAVSDGAGNVLVAWGDHRNAGKYFIGGHSDVYGARVRNGVAGANFAVATTTTEGLNHDEPTVAFDGTNFLVVSRMWLNSPPYTSGLEGARVSPGGALIDGFPIFTATDTNPYSSPSLAFGGSNYLLAYTYSTMTPPFFTSRTYATRITPDKQVLDPNGFAVSPPGPASSTNSPRVAFDGTNFLVAWSDNRNDPGDYTNLDVYGALVSLTGTVQGLPITTAPGSQYPLGVLDSGDGTTSVVLWYSYSQDSSTNPLSASRIDRSGSVLETDGIPVQSNINGGGALAGQGGGRVLVAYDRYDPELPFDTVRVRMRMLIPDSGSTTSTILPPSTSTTTTTTTTVGGGTSPTTTSSTPTTTTTVTTTVPGIPTICGNGMLDPGEDCDPGMAGVSDRCCIGCLRQGVGTPCRLTLQGPCDLTDVCDENAACVARYRGPEYSCREPFAAGNCDSGDFCDGAGPTCPTTNIEGECPITVKPAGHNATVECLAPARPDLAKGGSACAADAIDDRTASLTTNAAAGETVLMDLVEKPIKFRRKASQGHRKLKLRLNARGRKLLKSERTVTVRVRVTLRHGAGTVRRLFQILTLRR